jgi:Caspase domain
MLRLNDAQAAERTIMTMFSAGEAERSKQHCDDRCPRHGLRSHRALAGPALLALVLSGWVIPVEAKRVALVIGNDSYQSVTPLQNARSDARAVARVLERDGFNVTLKEDVTLKGMKDALRTFKGQISGGDEAVFYYSGHGVQFGGTNYLIPVDLVPQSEEQVVDDALPLQRVLDDLQDQKARFALAIVDACRDNPFRGTGRVIGSRGLAPVTAATGQMVLYSAGAGQEALDRLGPKDSDPNGVFTRVLIQEMTKPGLTAGQMVKNVRDQVVALARGVDHEQVPALYDQSVGEFCFVSGCVPGPEPVAPGPAPKPDKNAAEYFAQLASAEDSQQRQRIEQDLWELLRQSLPKTILYGFLAGKEGASRPVVGFEPAATTSDGRTVIVRSTLGELNSGRQSYSDAEITDYKLDCARREYVVVRKADHGGVFYPDEAARKSGAYTPEPGTGQDSLAQALCEAPLRITPLWAVDGIEWTDVGPGWKEALQITWSDPQRPKERYVLTRHDYSEPNFYGAQVAYFWAGIDCATRESRDTGYYEATAKGEVLKVTGSTEVWQEIKQNTVAANTYVLLCEH